MRYLQLLTLTLFLGASTAAVSQSKEGIYEQLDDIRVLSFISAQEIAASPEWQAGLGDVPLTVDQAIDAVREYRNNSSTEFTIDKIEIKPVPKHEQHWHYLILVANEAKVSKYDIFVVLMNGKVIPALLETRQ